MKIRIYLLVCVGFTQLNLKGQWDNYFTNNLPWPNIPYDLYFLDTLNGYASGRNGQTGGIFKTTDGGDTWSFTTPAGPVWDGEYSIIHFSDPLHGFAVGRYCELIRTSNGGQTWQSVITLDPDPSAYPVEIQFPDSLTGYVLIQNGPWWNAPKPVLLKTTNGGNSWSTINSPVKRNYDPGYNNPDHWLLFIDSLLGFSGGSPGWIYKTTNGAISWDSTAVDSGVIIESIIKVGNALMAGGMGGGSISTDFGNTWRPHCVPIYWSAIADTSCFIYTSNWEASHSICWASLLRTFDACNTWDYLYHGTNAQPYYYLIRKSHFIDRNHGFVLAGYCFGMAHIWEDSPVAGVWKMNANVVSIDPEHREKDIKIFPQPSTGKFFIDTGTIPPGNISISIFDFQSRRIHSETWNSNLEDSILEVDMSEQPSGIYFYRLKAGEEFGSGKIIIIK